MMSDLFYKFPQTCHLFDAGSSLSREDKLLSPSEAKLFYTSPVVIEEKIDGANLGFTLAEDGTILVQNRGKYVDANSHPQFARLNDWIFAHEEALFNLLIEDIILFGEWCYMRHSIHYDRLPDWFVAFDLYDRKAGKFWTRDRRTKRLAGTEICEVPLLGEGVLTKPDIEHMLACQSAFYDGPVEGVYLRLEGDDGLLRQRAKVVRPGFMQAIDTHWSNAPLHVNRLTPQRPLS